MRDDKPDAVNGDELRGAETVRLFYVTGVIIALLSALVFELFATPANAATYHVLSWGSVCVAISFLIGGWWTRRMSVAHGVVFATWSAIALICVVSVGLDEGIHALALGFFGVLVCVVTVISSVRAGIVMAAFCGLWVLGLAVAETQGWVRGAEAVPTSPFAMRVVTLLMMLVTALAVGQVVARLVGAHLLAVRERERRYRTLFEQSPAALLLHQGGVLLDANKAAVALLRLPPEVHGLSLGQLDDSISARMLRAVMEHGAQLDGAKVGTECARSELLIADAHDAHLLQASAVCVHGERDTATLSIVFDDSERYRAARASQQLHARLTNLVSASPDCVVLSRADNNEIVMVNERFAELTGVKAEAVVGRVVSELCAWLEAGDMQRFRADIAAQGATRGMISSFVLPSGEVREFDLSANSYEFEGVRYVVTVARDVAENELARREQRTILDTAALGIGLTRNDVITRVNGAAEAIFGYGSGQLEGVSALTLWSSPEVDRETMDAADRALRRGELVDSERELRRADGTPFWCRLRVRAVNPGRPYEDGLVWVIEDVTERRRMASALESARDAAEAASRAKSVFLANTSHEIRTPLNGLVGLARLALRPTTDADTRQRYLRQILDSAENLAEIMGGILDMSKIEAGKLELEVMPFDLHALCTNVRATYAAVAQTRGLYCSLDIGSDVPRFVVGDSLRARQVLANYVTNALKFTFAGGVAIRLREGAHGHVRIEVTDTGIGIEPATLTRLFQPFSQADDSTTRKFGGTGLGLSICRELAELMGGTVGAQSVPGDGSTFWAELPLPLAENYTLQHLHGDSAQGSAQLLQTDSVAKPLDGLDGVRVLLAEDNAVNRIIASTLLLDWRAQVTEATDGRAAVDAVHAAAARGQPFDLVLMDVQMPRLDGHAATRELRNRYGAADLPIVALTASALAAERDAALSAGMNAFVTKPIDEGALRQTLSDVLRIARGQAARQRGEPRSRA